jgi:hypothetical protein
MPNFTITVDSRTYHDARVWAAENDTTVTALVRSLLESLHPSNDVQAPRAHRMFKDPHPLPPFPVRL